MQRKIHEPSALLLLLCMYTCMFTHIARVSVDQPGRVAIPARGQLNRESVFFALSAFAPENLVSRHGFGCPVSRQPAHIHTRAESVIYSNREANINWSMLTCQGSTRSERPWGLLAPGRRTLGSERHRYAIA